MRVMRTWAVEGIPSHGEREEKERTKIIRLPKEKERREEREITESERERALLMRELS